MSSDYENSVSVNQIPFFDWTSQDTLRMGSFIAIQLKNQDPKTVTIARLEQRQREEDPLDPDESVVTHIRLRLFPPLFPTKPIDCHPRIPSHSIPKILHGCGSQNVELYESRECVWINGEIPDDEVKILFPAFVFSFEELEKSENGWAHGIHNVYFARFWHNKIYSYTVRAENRLDPIPKGTVLGFMNKHPLYKQPSNLIIARRCQHHAIWVGLFSIQKAIIKMLNKRGMSSSSRENISLNVGCIPLECIQYIYSLSKFVSPIDCHPVTLRDSFLHVDSSLTRRKLSMSFDAGVLRFKSISDLKLLRSIFGPSSTYGSSEKRPNLSDGSTGTTLKRGHHLSVISGHVNDNAEDEKFKRRSKEQRVDLCFSPFNVRVTVGYERYVYSLRACGSLKRPSHCPTLNTILRGQSPQTCSDTLQPIKPSSPPTDPSSETGKDSHDNPDESEEAEESPSDECNPPVLHPPALQNIQLGDQFLDGQTVYEVVTVNKTASTPVCTCRAVAGKHYDKHRPAEEQDTMERKDIVQLLIDIHDFA